jgi:carbonic anhydrase
MAALMRLVLLFFCMFATTHSCVFKYGFDPQDPLAVPRNSDQQFNYSFAGADWPGLCATGEIQSPINVPLAGSNYPCISWRDRTRFDFGRIKSNGTNIKLINLENVVQVEWSGALQFSKASVAVPSSNSVLLDALRPVKKTFRAPLTPLQFHFHTHSEHGIDGTFYPAEAHIVCRTQKSALSGCSESTGCLAVVGIMFALDPEDKDNEFLKPILDNMPGAASKGLVAENFLPAGTELNFAHLMPKSRTYATYPGSLTTPPCSEGLLWHVMAQPQTLSVKQMQQLMDVTGDLSCNLDGEKQPTSCKQLGAGQNFRIVQPLGTKRNLQIFKDFRGI